MIIVLMGVSGSGKTTVGSLLAARLGWKFYDADDFHTPANIAKMRSGVPLTEDDRVPWLAALHAKIDQQLADGQPGVFACSALTRFDRAQLLGKDPGIEVIYLHGDFDLIYRRMQARHGHFFPPEMLASQFRTLQEPDDVFAVSVDQPPEAIVDEIVGHLGLSSATAPT